jgi:hypothetical protein
MRPVQTVAMRLLAAFLARLVALVRFVRALALFVPLVPALWMLLALPLVALARRDRLQSHF